MLKCFLSFESKTSVIFHPQRRPEIVFNIFAKACWLPVILQGGAISRKGKRLCELILHFMLAAKCKRNQGKDSEAICGKMYSRKTVYIPVIDKYSLKQVNSSKKCCFRESLWSSYLDICFRAVIRMDSTLFHSGPESTCKGGVPLGSLSAPVARQQCQTAELADWYSSARARNEKVNRQFLSTN